MALPIAAISAVRAGARRWAIPARRSANVTRRSKDVPHAQDIIKTGSKVADLVKEIGATDQREGILRFARSHLGHGTGVDGYDPPGSEARSMFSRGRHGDRRGPGHQGPRRADVPAHVTGLRIF
jgi:hypothetical protein